MRAMILAAGYGTRMGDVTQSVPKPMIIVSGRPQIEHRVLALKKSGIEEIVINVSWLKEVIMEYLGDGKKFGVSILYSVEENKPLGTGGGIKKALPLLGDKPFWLMNADVQSDFEIDKEMTLAKNRLGHLILVDNPPHHMQGDFCLDRFRVFRRDGMNDLTFSGISLISPKIFENCNDEDFPLEPVLYELALKSKLSGQHHTGKWLDVGSPQRHLQAESD